MPFKKYESIDNEGGWSKYISKFDGSYPLDSCPATVTEKIHGTNFGIGTDGDTVFYQKRGGSLDPGSGFFGFQSIRGKYEKTIVEIFKMIPNAQSIIVYGEMYGPGLGPGIWYSDTAGFRAFDIYVIYTDRKVMFPYATAVKMFEQTGLPHVPILFSGTFADCIKWTRPYIEMMEQQVTNPAIVLPEYFGKDPDNHENSRPEGYVIKSDLEAYDNGDGLKVKYGEFQYQRPVLKLKNILFDERSEMVRKLSELRSTVVQPQKPTKEKVVKPHGPNEIFFREISKARLESVLTKIEPKPENKDNIIKALIEDAIDTVQRDHFDDYKPLEATLKNGTKKAQAMVDSYIK